MDLLLIHLKRNWMKWKLGMFKLLTALNAESEESGEEMELRFSVSG